MADRIAFLDQGRVREAGTTQEFRASRDPLVREFLASYPEQDNADGGRV